MDDLALLLNEPLSVAILVVSAALLLAPLVSKRLREYSRRQQRERGTTLDADSVQRTSNFGLGGVIGSLIGALLGFAVSGFTVSWDRISTGAILGLAVGESIALAVSASNSGHR